MASTSSVCPRCQANLSANNREAPSASCPDCGEPLAAPVTPPRRRLRSALLVISLLGLIGGACFQGYRTILPEIQLAAANEQARKLVEAGPAVPPKPQTTEEIARELEDWIVRSRLVLTGPASREEGRPVAYLARPTGGGLKSELAESTNQGILAREIVRQAVLIAARDELGMVTRDELIGDEPTTGQGTASAEVSWLFPTESKGWVRIDRDTGQREVLLPRCDLLDKDYRVRLRRLAVLAEALSRNEFPRTLRRLGVEGKPHQIRTDDEARLPGLVAERLERLSFVDLFAAVRDLHAAIAEDGESPVRLGALVRAYGLLGVVSEFQWTPAHKVYKARAWLYAQRLVARDPKSPWGFWHRAYAETLAGQQTHALDDLARADALLKKATEDSAPATAAPQTAPPWVAVIDAACHYDLDKLKTIDGPGSRLATLLRMAALEYPAHWQVALTAAHDVLAPRSRVFSSS